MGTSGGCSVYRGKYIFVSKIGEEVIENFEMNSVFQKMTLRKLLREWVPPVIIQLKHQPKVIEQTY